MNKIFKITLTVISLFTILFLLFNDTTIEMKLLLIMSMIVAIMLTWLDHETNKLNNN